MIALCLKCNREHRIAGREPGTSIRCSCGYVFSTPEAKPFYPEILRCGSCGGSVSPSAMRCDYCGGAVKPFDTGRYCARCYAFLAVGAEFCSWCGAYAAHADQIPEQSSFSCPRDDTQLTGIPIGSSHGEECKACGGLWLRRSDFQHILDEQKERPADDDTQSERRAIFRGEARYLKCPECGELMSRQNYKGISGTIIDACPAHGVWLDKDELYDIVRFLRSGGLERAAARKARDQARALEDSAGGRSADLLAQGILSGELSAPAAADVLKAVGRLMNMRTE